MTSTSIPCRDVPDPDRRKRSSWEVLLGVAHELAAGDALVWQRLLADHLPDRSGRCHLCPGAVWPCTLHGVAGRAAMIVNSSPADGGTPGMPETTR